MHDSNRRHFLKAASALTAPALLHLSHAQSADFPTRPITLIVPQPAGGDADVFCRTLQPKMQEFLGQSVIIDNRGGAAGNVGTALGSKAAPDGYTLTFVNQGTMVFNPYLYSSTGYNVSDLVPVSHLASVDLIICANPNLGVNNLKDLLALAKRKPGSINYATAGSGSANHLAGEMLKTKAGVFLTHIPYRGGGPAITAALGGEVETVIAFPLAALPHIKAGKLKALAVTGRTRSSALPDVPTVAESGVKDYEFSSWFGFALPKGTPETIVNKLNAAASHALKTPAIEQRLLAGLTRPIASSPADFAKLIASENALWGKLIKQFNVKID